MIKSVKEFDNAVCCVLKHIMDNNPIENCPAGLEERDYNDILAHIAKNQLAISLECTMNQIGGYSVTAKGTPRLTRDGLSFIEKMTS
jgi:hypothetical protein